MDRYCASARDFGCNVRCDRYYRHGDMMRERETSPWERTGHATRSGSHDDDDDDDESNDVVEYHRSTRRGTTDEPSSHYRASADGGRGDRRRRGAISLPGPDDDDTGSDVEHEEREHRGSRRGTAPRRRADRSSGDEARSGGRNSMARTVGEYGSGLHADHGDLVADSNITNADDFERALRQRGYVQDRRGRYHHPRHDRHAGEVSWLDDDSEDDGGMRRGRLAAPGSRGASGRESS